MYIARKIWIIASTMEQVAICETSADCKLWILDKFIDMVDGRQGLGYTHEYKWADFIEFSGNYYYYQNHMESGKGFYNA